MSDYQNLFAALTKAQGEMGKLVAGNTATVKSEKANYSYTYADLADVLNVALKALTAHGLGIMQFPEVTFEGGFTSVAVGATLFHSSGEFMPVPPLNMRIRANATAQEIGSAITYARRYQMQSVLGLSPDEDDDGKKATDAKADDSTQHRNQRQPQPPPKPAVNGTNGAGHRKATPPADAQQPAASNAQEFDAIPDAKTSDNLDMARKAFHAQIAGTFPKGDEDDARHWFITKWTTAYTPDSVRESATDLTVDELSKMTAALKGGTKKYRDMWLTEKTAPIPAAK